MVAGKALRMLVVVIIAGGINSVVSGSLVSASAVGAASTCATPDATHFTVSSSSDSGAGSLRSAMAAAQAAGGTICVTPGLGPITLATQISVEGTPGVSLAIVGNGTTVVGSSDDEDGAALRFNTPWTNVSMQCQFHGVSCPPVENVSVGAIAFTGGHGGDSGAVWTGQAVDLALDGDTFTSNSAGPRNVGGAVDVADRGSLSVIDSSFLDNTDACDSCGPDGGGAILSNGDPITVSGSTFAGNSTSGPGGAIDAGYDGTVQITESTFSDNTSSGGNNNLGGAIYATGTLDLVASTFVGNTATSGATIWGYDTSIAASILKGVTGVPTCAGPVTSAGYNLSDEMTDSCNLTGVGDRVVAGSLTGLGPLADNGGPTETIMPLGGSPVAGVIPANTTVQVDGQSTPLCPATDQRGVTTLSGAPCAAGSVQGQAPGFTSASSATFVEGVPGSFEVTATGAPEPTFSAIGPLPAGVAFEDATGHLSGTPRTSGRFPITITATNGNGPAATQRFTLTVTGLLSVPQGYWLVGADGGVFSYGSAPFRGSTAELRLNRPIVGMAAAVDHNGYWLVGADGGVFAFGDAGYFGSVPGLGIAPAGSVGPGTRLNSPIVGMVPSVDDRGYLLVAADGGVFAFGDAIFAGSCPGSGGCSGQVTAIVSDHSGAGYWVVTRAGGVYPFGDAPAYGQPGPQGSATVAALGSPGGDGYWVLLSDGAVFSYGDARYHGGAAGLIGDTPAVGICGTTDGDGYRITTGQGQVLALGSATDDGGMVGRHLNGAIVGVSGF